MLISLDDFEKICRKAQVVNEVSPTQSKLHPFEEKSIYASFPNKVKKLFDDGHYSEATFEALKFFDKKIQNISSLRDSGHSLMMNALNPKNPSIKLTDLGNQSEIDEQEGYRFLFAGLMSAIRNPKGHEHSIEDDVDTCLDHLILISTFIRRIETAGYGFSA